MRLGRVEGFALVLAFAISGCGGAGSKSTTVTIKGSDTMVILGQRWAEKYMAAHPGTVVQVTGGGTGTGIAALINGTTDICQASRPMKDKEREQVQARFGEAPHEVVVAKDGLAVYVHAQNPVTEFTVAQLRDIYTGRTTSWSAFGGPSATIVLYGRENSSGTYEYFKEHVLGGADFAAAVQTLPGTAAVVNAVGKDPRGIGYGGAAYLKGVKECSVRKDAGSAAVPPSAENVLSGAYPISRDLYLYTRRTPEGAIKDFIDFALSDSGQAVVTQVGYYPLR
jgi:phosphate transport system substrate-binding protein